MTTKVVLILLLNFLHGVILHAFLLSAHLFKLHIFKENTFRNKIRVSNKLDPDQTGRFMEPGIGPDLWQRLSAINKSCQGQVKILCLYIIFTHISLEFFLCDIGKQCKTRSNAAICGV